MYIDLAATRNYSETLRGVFVKIIFISGASNSSVTRNDIMRLFKFFFFFLAKMSSYTRILLVRCDEEIRNYRISRRYEMETVIVNNLS